MQEKIRSKSPMTSPIKIENKQEIKQSWTTSAFRRLASCEEPQICEVDRLIWSGAGCISSRGVACGWAKDLVGFKDGHGTRTGCSVYRSFGTINSKEAVSNRES
jgi:hypothetical protein